MREMEELEENHLPGLVFRNYNPMDENLKVIVAEQKKQGDVEVLDGDASKIPKPTPDLLTTTLEEQVRMVGDNLNIAPKKANWDLKRDIQEKLDVLQRRTKRAIVELLREKIAERGEEEEDDDDDDDDLD